MTTVTQNEEDLIIIGDETDSDKSIIDFDFSQRDEVTSPQESDFIIDFSDAEKNEVSTDFVLDTAVSTTEENSEVISFSEDFFAPQEDKIEEPVAVLVQEENVWAVSEIDFWFAEEVQTENIVAQTEVGENVQAVNFEMPEEKTQVESAVIWAVAFDRNTILDEAIAKMQSRKWTIWQTKDQRQAQVDQLKEQMKKLQEQVSDLEKEIKDLEKEDSTLDLDITSIEKMKSSILEVATDRPRKHNLSNIKK